jgi:superfamily II DNA or RNA helicase
MTTENTNSTEINIDEFYGEKELRWYQIATRNQCIKSIEQGKKRILIYLATGTGKSLTVACTIGSPELKRVLNVHDRKLRILFIAHNSRLLTQAERTFAAENNVELILQSMMSLVPQDIIDAGWDITVIDEAHHEACSSMQLQLESIVGDKPIIGLSATPDRADGCIIKFEEIISPISREQAVKEGYLAETYLNTIVDGSERSKAEITIDILNEYAHKMNGTLIFVRTKKEVSTINAHIEKMGYKSVALLDQSAEEMDEILDSFSRKEVQFIVSCQRLSEGVDISHCETVVVGRNIGSLSLLNQMVGRAARPDCNCNIYEIVNPLSKDNLDVTCIVGTPLEHKIIFQERGKWVEEFFDYTR